MTPIAKAAPGARLLTPNDRNLVPASARYLLEKQRDSGVRAA